MGDGLALIIEGELIMVKPDCRMCHSKELEMYLDLGFTPLADAFLTIEHLDEPEVFYPLKVNVCTNCSSAKL